MSSETLKQPICSIPLQGRMAECIKETIRTYKPKRIIETGTYCGMGSTTIITEILKEMDSDDSIFFSIEVNPDFHKQAVEHIEKEGLRDYVHLLHGLSLWRKQLPTVKQLKKILPEGYVHSAETLFADTDFPGVADGLLEYCLIKFDYKPDLILLDSGNHLGWLEFQQVINTVKGKCILILDDIHDLKHARSYGVVKSDPRFKIIHDGDEERYFVIAEFDPGGM
jgi:hypothetical protein